MKPKMIQNNFYVDLSMRCGIFLLVSVMCANFCDTATAQASEWKESINGHETWSSFKTAADAKAAVLSLNSSISPPYRKGAVVKSKRRTHISISETSVDGIVRYFATPVFEVTYARIPQQPTELDLQTKTAIATAEAMLDELRPKLEKLARALVKAKNSKMASLSSAVARIAAAEKSLRQTLERVRATKSIIEQIQQKARNHLGAITDKEIASLLHDLKYESYVVRTANNTASQELRHFEQDRDQIVSDAEEEELWKEFIQQLDQSQSEELLGRGLENNQSKVEAEAATTQKASQFAEQSGQSDPLHAKPNPLQINQTFEPQRGERTPDLIRELIADANPFEQTALEEELKAAELPKVENPAVVKTKEVYVAVRAYLEHEIYPEVEKNHPYYWRRKSYSDEMNNIVRKNRVPLFRIYKMPLPENDPLNMGSKTLAKFQRDINSEIENINMINFKTEYIKRMWPVAEIFAYSTLAEARESLRNYKSRFLKGEEPTDSLKISTPTVYGAKQVR